MSFVSFQDMLHKHKWLGNLPIYIILVIALYIALGQLSHSIHVWCMRGGMVHLYRLSDAMLLALPIFFMKKKKIVIPYVIIINLYLLSIIWYFRTYGTIMPLTSYLMFHNLVGLGPCIKSSIYAKDIRIVLPSICFVVFYIWAFKRVRRFPKIDLCSFVLSGCIIGGIALTAYWPNKPTFYDKPFYFFTVEQTRSFREFGIIHFWIYQIHSYQGVSEEDKEDARAFMHELEAKGDFTNCDSLQSKKNLILILVESMQSWPINMAVEGTEVTPYINQLVKLSDSQYFSKVIPQVKDGRSSDAQLLINAGLLPLATGATCGTHNANVFPSLPDALKKKGYTSVSLICDSRQFWNQETMAIAYHFDKLYDNLMEDEGVAKADEHLFENAISIIPQLPTPFYAQVVTLSAHAPYLEPLMDSPLKNAALADDEVKNYLIAMLYADKCIGNFINKLKETGLYDNSVIVITGDHEAMPCNRYEGRKELLAMDCSVPFIILNSPLSSAHTDKVIGQVDIYPSILNMMGCCDYSFKGLGESVFSDSISNYAIYRTGISASGTEVPDSVKHYRKRIWDISNILIRMDYFR